MSKFVNISKKAWTNKKQNIEYIYNFICEISIYISKKKLYILNIYKI